jgi:hypothetical protein
MRTVHKAVAFIAGFAALLTAGVVLAGRAGAAVLGDAPRPLGTGGPRAASPFPAYDPRRLTHLGDARQLIVVAGESPTSSYSTLRTYEKQPPAAGVAGLPGRGRGPEIRSTRSALPPTVITMFALGLQLPTWAAPVCVLPGFDPRI